MAKFRKRPVVIEAEQFQTCCMWPEGVYVARCQHNTARDAMHGRSYWPVGTPVIETLEGTMLVSDGDWIITGVNGEKYPCKPDVFAKTYEPVDEEARKLM